MKFLRGFSLIKFAISLSFSFILIIVGGYLLITKNPDRFKSLSKTPLFSWIKLEKKKKFKPLLDPQKRDQILTMCVNKSKVLKGKFRSGDKNLKIVKIIKNHPASKVIKLWQNPTPLERGGVLDTIVTGSKCFKVDQIGDAIFVINFNTGSCGWVFPQKDIVIKDLKYDIIEKSDEKGKNK